MTVDLLEKLNLAHRAVLDLDTPRAIELLDEVRDSEVIRPDHPQAGQISTQLRNIVALASAARDGVAAARAQLQELSQISQSFESYDSAGNMQRRNMPAHTVRKF